MLSDGDDIGSRNFEDLNTVFDSGVEVNVVRANTGGDTELKVLGL